MVPSSKATCCNSVYSLFCSQYLMDGSDGIDDRLTPICYSKQFNLICIATIHDNVPSLNRQAK